MTQLSLLEDAQREERPWKRVRPVSIGSYGVHQTREAAKARDGKETKTQRVVRCLAAMRNRSMRWPTPLELLRYMVERHEIAREDSRLIAPRLTELVKGKVVTRKDGSKARIGGGFCVLEPARKCAVSGEAAHPVAIREAGATQIEVNT